MIILRMSKSNCVAALGKQVNAEIYRRDDFSLTKPIANLFSLQLNSFFHKLNLLISLIYYFFRSSAL